MLRLTFLLPAAIGIGACSAAAQEVSVEATLTQPGVRADLEYIEGHRLETAELLRRFGGIISPSGEEHPPALRASTRAYGSW